PEVVVGGHCGLTLVVDDVARRQAEGDVERLCRVLRLGEREARHDLKVGARDVGFGRAALVRQDERDVPPALRAGAERTGGGAGGGGWHVGGGGGLGRGAEGEEREPVEDAVLGVEPALPWRALASLAVRGASPGLVPTLAEERREWQRLPPSRRVDVPAQ